MWSKRERNLFLACFGLCYSVINEIFERYNAEIAEGNVISIYKEGGEPLFVKDSIIRNTKLYVFVSAEEKKWN